MKTLLKNARESKGLKTRELAQILSIDQALVSKYESGTRRPTKEQIVKLAALLEINFETLMTIWLKEKIIYEIGQEEFALQALKDAEAEIKFLRTSSTNRISTQLQKLLDEIDILKVKLQKYDPLLNSDILETLELEYTFESNRLEGNTLTLAETMLVINEGQTIAGKSMREHMEALNHSEAIAIIKNISDKNLVFSEREFLGIHGLILRGIFPKEAGQYRKVAIATKEKNFTPVEPSKIQKEMEELFNWYEINKNSLHPVILATEMQQRILTIYPFTNGNGKVSRLIMNLILMQNGYVIANIKGDSECKIQYYQKLENAVTGNDKEGFLLFIAETEKISLKHYISINSQ